MEALAEAIQGGHLPARLALVVADRPHAPAVERARRHGLATLVLPFRGAPPERWSRGLTDHLERAGVELVVTAGFLSILPDDWVARWNGRVVNLHPSLLPKYGGRGMYGRKVLEATLAAGDTVTGVTVHLTTPAIDAGPILLQRTVPVAPGETPESLRERLRPVEHAAVIEVVRRFATGEWSLPYEPLTSVPGRDERPG